jgi:hypothetical protein
MLPEFPLVQLLNTPVIAELNIENTELRARMIIIITTTMHVLV